jgi:Putative regulator of cell autolysis
MTSIAFWIDETNHFHQGPLGHTCYIISGILLAYLLTLTFLEKKQQGEVNLWIPVMVTVMIVFCTVLDYFVVYEEQIISFLTIGIVNGSVYFYIWLHLRFVLQHRHAVETEQRIRIMISQIQPHFMYNTLAAIQALCYSEPEKAATMVEKFACYLRQNLDSLEEESMIPLRKELEHTRIYAEIEMGMYPSIHLEEDIEDDQVMLPALTIQPLVENAIRYGIRGKENGTVRIAARREGEDHIIRIEDNGTGFDPKKAIEHDGNRSHIGIRNVKERLQTLCRGEMRIDSVIGEGTTITIRIPAQKQNEKGPDSLQK